MVGQKVPSIDEFRPLPSRMIQVKYLHQLSYPQDKQFKECLEY